MPWCSLNCGLASAMCVNAMLALLWSSKSSRHAVGEGGTPDCAVGHSLDASRMYR